MGTIRRRLLLVLAMACTGCADPSPETPDRRTDRPTDPAGHAERQAGFGSLHPDAPPETAHWGQLAGVWGCEVASTGSDGSVTRSRATWTWSYMIGGHAVRDAYVGYDAQGNPTFHGSGVRAYNPATDTWEIAWVASRGGGDRITRFEATSEPGRVTMSRVPHDPTWRTVFYDIRSDGFEWRSEPSGQSMRCVREAP